MTTTRTTARRASGILAAAASLALLAPAAAVAAPTTASADGPARALGQAVDEAEINDELERASAKALEKLDPAPIKGTPPGQANKITDALDAGMAKVVEEGAVAVTVQVDTPTFDWKGSAGQRDLQKKSPAGWQDSFLAASNTKMMLATASMQLIEEGEWTLDTTIEDVLPGMVTQNSDVTIFELLSHTSGMPNGTSEVMVPYQDPENDPLGYNLITRHYTVQDHINVANDFPWSESGEFAYSNTAYAIVGFMLEEATGTPLPELIAQRVFKPAGMKHSVVATGPREAENPHLVEAGWLGEELGGWWDVRDFDPTVFYGAGSMYSTTGDLIAFHQALHGGELVSDELLEVMKDVVVEEGGYGSGLYAVDDPCAADGEQAYLHGHSGGSWGTTSWSLSSPDGERQVALAVTGRNLSDEDIYSMSDIFQPALAATCAQ